MKKLLIVYMMICLAMGLASCGLNSESKDSEGAGDGAQISENMSEDTSEDDYLKQTRQQKQEGYEGDEGILIEGPVKGDYCILDYTDGPLIVVAKNNDKDSEKETDEEDHFEKYDKFKYGAMNDNGDIVIPCEYDFIKYINISQDEDEEIPRYHVKKDGLYGVLDDRGNEIIPCEFACIIREDAPIVAAKKEDQELFAFFSMTDGKQVTESGFKDIGYSLYTTALRPAPLLAVQFENDKWGYINYEGETVVEPKYKKVEGFTEHGGAPFACVSMDGEKFGLIDPEGNSLLPCKYNSVLDHADGLSVVFNGDPSRENYDDPGDPDEVGVVDKNGKTVIPFEPCGYNFEGEGTGGNEYFSEMELYNGKIIVNRGGYTTVDGASTLVAFAADIYDSKGNSLAKGKYSSVTIMGGNLIVKSAENKKMGLLDKDLKTLLPCKYYYIKHDHDDVLAVKEKKGDPRTLTDLNGKAIESGNETVSAKQEYVEGDEIAPFGPYSKIIKVSDNVLAVRKDKDGLFALAEERDGELVEITEPIFNFPHVCC